MSEGLALATGFVDAANKKDVEALAELLHEDVVLDTLMGKQKGRKQARAGFEMMLKMGGGDIESPELTDDGVKALAVSPVGKMTMSFDFADDKISSIVVKMGSYK